MSTMSSTSPKEGPTIVPSSTTKSLPSVVVQLILEAFVADIVENAQPMGYRVTTDYDEETGSMFELDTVEHRLAKRWSEIQTPFHVNKRTRALMQKHFFSYPSDGRKIQGWICSRWDRFYYYICEAEKYYLEEESTGLYLEKHPDRGRVGNMQRGIENPAPFDVQLVQGMQIVYGYGSDLFSDGFWWQPELQLAFSLPNLREIHIGVGHTRKEYSRETRRRFRKPDSWGTPQPIDAVKFPGLAKCGYDDGEIFEKCARKAQERGVRILCVERVGRAYWERLELLRTPEGTMMKFLDFEKELKIAAS